MHPRLLVPLRGRQQTGSIPGLFLVSKGQHIHCVGAWVVAIECNIARVTEANQQFAQWRQVGEWAADLGAGFQQGELPLYALTSTSSSLRVVLCKKLAAAFKAESRARSDN